MHTLSDLEQTWASFSEDEIAEFNAALAAWREQIAADREASRNAPKEVEYDDDPEEPLPLPWPIHREIWRVVPGVEFYRVSTLGRVQRATKRSGVCLWKPKILRQQDHEGYLTVNVRDGWGRSRHARVHRMVLAAFVGHPPEGRYDTRHLDGSRNNNSVNNLCYGSCRENYEDRLLHEEWRAEDPDWDASVFWADTLADEGKL